MRSEAEFPISSYSPIIRVNVLRVTGGSICLSRAHKRHQSCPHTFPLCDRRAHQVLSNLILWPDRARQDGLQDCTFRSSVFLNVMLTVYQLLYLPFFLSLALAKPIHHDLEDRRHSPRQLNRPDYIPEIITTSLAGPLLTPRDMDSPTSPESICAITLKVSEGELLLHAEVSAQWLLPKHDTCKRSRIERP